MRKRVAWSFILSLLGVLALGRAAQAAAGQVLILGSTVSGGASSSEAAAVTAAGKTPVVVTNAAWAAMSAAAFAEYDAIVLGDATCSTDQALIAAAVANKLSWGSSVDGNVIIIGSDPVFHGKTQLINQGIAFAASEASQTGAYIDLSCYYHFSPSGTPVPVLDGLNGGGFTVIGASSLPGLNDVHITATHPALAGLTDAYLSGWNNSVHEGFNTWPLDFEALAIARDARGSYTAPDGTVGFPYILARGVTVISDISLTPEDAVNPLNTAHELTATARQNGAPLPSVVVTFTVIDGPHVGTTGTDVTDSNGQATFSYTGTVAGVDTIEATFVNAQGITQRSNRVKKTWEEKLCAPCGDLDGDCDVDTQDYTLFRASYGKKLGQSGYNAEADMNKSGGAVNLIDYGIWNKCYQDYNK